MSLYNTKFYSSINAGSLRSAEECIAELSKQVSFNSVVDVGAGSGAWSSVLSNFSDGVVSIDGEYAASNFSSLIETRDNVSFYPRNLNQKNSLEFDREFDLAISLEVAEHLDSERAESFVSELTKLAPIVVFSAALPYQGGTGHVNENWLEYWIDLFEQRGFYCYDYLRKKLWHNVDVEWWYKQNMLLFSNEAGLERIGEAMKMAEVKSGDIVSVIHPEMYLWAVHRANSELKRTLGQDKSFYRRCAISRGEYWAPGYGDEFID